MSDRQSVRRSSAPRQSFADHPRCQRSRETPDDATRSDWSACLSADSVDVSAQMQRKGLVVAAGRFLARADRTAKPRVGTRLPALPELPHARLRRPPAPETQYPLLSPARRSQPAASRSRFPRRLERWPRCPHRCARSSGNTESLRERGCLCRAYRNRTGWQIAPPRETRNRRNFRNFRYASEAHAARPTSLSVRTSRSVRSFRRSCKAGPCS